MRAKQLYSTSSILIVVILSIIFDNGTYAFQGLRTRYPMSIYVSDPFPYTERCYLTLDNVCHTFVFTHYGVGCDAITRYIGNWYMSGDTIIATPELECWQVEGGNVHYDELPTVDEFPITIETGDVIMATGDTIKAVFKYLLTDSCIYDVSDIQKATGRAKNPSFVPYHLTNGPKIQDIKTKK